LPLESSTHDRLNSWKEIAAYTGRDVRTVIRWGHKAGFPVYRVPIGERKAVYAYRSEIDAWIRRGSESTANETPKPSKTEIPQALEPSTPDQTVAPRKTLARLPKHLWIWAALAAPIAISALVIHSLTAPRRLAFTDVRQITNDGINKVGLVTDGKLLYFAERRNARTELASVSVQGGPINVISSPLVNAIPKGLSPDGKSLLVLGSEGEEQEQPLWIVPLNGPPPHRLSTILAHSAAWSPDGQRIAFAHENAIYLTNGTGTTLQQLQAFSSVPSLLRWTDDGSGLRFTLQDAVSGRSALWQLALDGQSPAVVSSLIPLHVGIDDCCGSMTSVNHTDESFLGGAGTLGDQILLVTPWRSLRRTGFETQRMNRLVGRVEGLALDPDGARVFVLSDSAASSGSTSPDWSDLVSVDTSSHEFRPFLSGISAEDLDFSRDGKWIVWLQPIDHTLWIGRADGSERRQIQVAPSDKQLPRWSPDGRTIAFMAKFPGRPWRIFLLSVDSGQIVEASTGLDSQGAPTWSPDGKWLAYGNVLCEETNSCAIHKIEVSTGRESVLPESEGLETARWSPDGRFIAALQPQGHQIFLFVVKTEVWKRLADHANGNNLNWSPDSRYLYASSPNGDKPSVMRISPKDDSVVQAVDLSSFAHWTGRIDPWFALAPDNSVIFLRREQPKEIYALTLRER
jgi:Tol biopolymer transport system component/predicted DNA-binding transcriptional regulator AlpA